MVGYVGTNRCTRGAVRECASEYASECVSELALRACLASTQEVYTEAMIYRVLSLPSNVRENLPLRSLTTAI